MYYVYILANKKNGTLYVGSINDLTRRVWEHKNYIVKGLTQKYGVHQLVYFEQYDDIRLANQREANIKHWYRKWKLDLIESMNPEWKDLYEDVCI